MKDQVNRILKEKNLKLIDFNLFGGDCKVLYCGDHEDSYSDYICKIASEVEESFIDYISEFEIEEIKRESDYDPLIESLSKKHNFFFCQKEILNEILKKENDENRLESFIKAHEIKGYKTKE